MPTSDSPADGSAPETPSDPAAPGPAAGASIDAATAARVESEEGASGPAIELGLETVELSASEERAVSEAASGGPMDPGASARGAENAAEIGGTPVGGTRSENPKKEGQTEIRPATVEPEFRPSGWFMAVTAFIVAAIDLGSKEWAKWALAGPDLRRTSKHIVVIPGHLDFIFAQNPGGAWSFLRSVPDGLRRPFFLFVSSAAIVFIVTVYMRLEKRQWAMRWGLPLALGGAIGNLVDRVRYGWVCDFIDAYYKGGANEVHWPTFNPADIAIVAGVALMALDLLSLRNAHPPAQTPASPAEPAGGAA